MNRSGILCAPTHMPSVVRPGLLEEISAELAQHGIEPKPMTILRHALERGVEPDLARTITEAAARQQGAQHDR